MNLARSRILMKSDVHYSERRNEGQLEDLFEPGEIDL